MLRKFTMCWTIPGTLSANCEFIATMPSDCTIRHMSMVATNASSGRIMMGTADDADEFLQYTDIGDSDTPVELDEATDFRYDTFPRLEKGDVLKILLDYDGASGTAAQNVTIVLTLQEG